MPLDVNDVVQDLSRGGYIQQFPILDTRDAAGRNPSGRANAHHGTGIASPRSSFISLRWDGASKGRNGRRPDTGLLRLAEHCLLRHSRPASASRRHGWPSRRSACTRERLLGFRPVKSNYDPNRKPLSDAETFLIYNPKRFTAQKACRISVQPLSGL